MLKIYIGIIFIIFFIISVSLGIFGLLYKPTVSPIDLNNPNFHTNHGKNNKTSCTESTPRCTSTTDCDNLCEETGVEITCQQIGNAKDKICAPVGASSKCNEKLGGVPVWQSWGGLSRMQWNCRCDFPLWAATDQCNTINNDICRGSLNPNNAFNWETPSPSPPNENLCTCNSDENLYKRRDSSTPFCASKNIDPIWYSDTTTKV